MMLFLRKTVNNTSRKADILSLNWLDCMINAYFFFLFSKYNKYKCKFRILKILSQSFLFVFFHSSPGLNVFIRLLKGYWIYFFHIFHFVLEINPQDVCKSSLPSCFSVSTFYNNMHEFIIHIGNDCFKLNDWAHFDWGQKLDIVDMGANWELSC